MRLTKKKAIQISIELWTELAETGGGPDDKFAWSGWEKYGEMIKGCSLCEYALGMAGGIENGCEQCPYLKMYGGKCYGKPYTQPYAKWEVEADVPKIRKKYAALFLSQLMEL